MNLPPHHSTMGRHAHVMSPTTSNSGCLFSFFDNILISVIGSGPPSTTTKSPLSVIPLLTCNPTIEFYTISLILFTQAYEIISQFHKSVQALSSTSNACEYRQYHYSVNDQMEVYHFLK